MWPKFPMNIKTQVCMKQHPISSQLGQKRQAVKYPPLYVWAGSGAMVLKRYEYKEMFSDHLFNFNHKKSKGATLSAHFWKHKN